MGSEDRWKIKTVLHSLVLLWTQMEGKNGGGLGTRLCMVYVCVYDHVHVCVYKCSKSLTCEGGSTTIIQVPPIIVLGLFVFPVWFFSSWYNVLIFSHTNTLPLDYRPSLVPLTSFAQVVNPWGLTWKALRTLFQSCQNPKDKLLFKAALLVRILSSTQNCWFVVLFLCTHAILRKSAHPALAEGFYSQTQQSTCSYLSLGLGQCMLMLTCKHMHTHTHTHTRVSLDSPQLQTHLHTVQNTPSNLQCS